MIKLVGLGGLGLCVLSCEKTQINLLQTVLIPPSLPPFLIQKGKPKRKFLGIETKTKFCKELFDLKMAFVKLVNTTSGCS